jgi:hypothetical protein
MSSRYLRVKWFFGNTTIACINDIVLEKDVRYFCLRTSVILYNKKNLKFPREESALCKLIHFREALGRQTAGLGTGASPIAQVQTADIEGPARRIHP